jgi:hypothetical protein
MLMIWTMKCQEKECAEALPNEPSDRTGDNRSTAQATSLAGHYSAHPGSKCNEGQE